MTDQAPSTRRTIAVFGDHGDTEHAPVYQRAAAAFARADIDVVVMPDGGSGGLVAALRSIPGLNVAVADADDASPQASRIALALRADALIGLPARLGPVADLYMTWVAGRDHNGLLLPVGLLNQKKAFEVVRGFMGDVAGVGLGRTDHLVQFADSIEDLLARVLRLTPVTPEAATSTP